MAQEEQKYHIQHHWPTSPHPSHKDSVKTSMNEACFPTSWQAPLYSGLWLQGDRGGPAAGPLTLSRIHSIHACMHPCITPSSLLFLPPGHHLSIHPSTPVLMESLFQEPRAPTVNRTDGPCSPGVYIIIGEGMCVEGMQDTVFQSSKQPGHTCMSPPSSIKRRKQSNGKGCAEGGGLS